MIEIFYFWMGFMAGTIFVRVVLLLTDDRKNESQ